MKTLLGKRRKHVLEVLIDEQLKYHRDRGDMARNADKTFASWGAGFFAAVWVCVLLELTATRLGWRPGWELFYGFLAIVLRPFRRPLSEFEAMPNYSFWRNSHTT